MLAQRHESRHILAVMTSYIDAALAPVKNDGQIKLYGPGDFAAMRRAGRLVAECLDALEGVVRPGLATDAIDGFVLDTWWRPDGATLYGETLRDAVLPELAGGEVPPGFRFGILWCPVWPRVSLPVGMGEPSTAEGPDRLFPFTADDLLALLELRGCADKAVVARQPVSRRPQVEGHVVSPGFEPLV